VELMAKTPEHLKTRATYDSRYICSAIHIDDFVSPGRRRYGMCEFPDIDLTSYDRHTVVEADIGRIDLIAYKWYSDVRLWWVICVVNNIANVFEDLEVGQTLKIPKRSSVDSALARISRQ